MIVNKIVAQPKQDEINVIVEIPMNSDPVKYEYDKDAGAIVVDRFMQTCMFYPCNYGFIPNTLSEDGDPVDVLLVSNYPVISGAVVRCRAVGVLMMEDESGLDEKIIAVPISKLDPTFDHIKGINDLSSLLKARIVHFFEHYKDLEQGKWVSIKGWQETLESMKIINAGVARFIALAT
ncbi:MAG: inorganic diphosphatase [Rickettsiaceae bacterium]|nr:MAG: inorganic diphosphatase [Rickettsiaceae bacterium]